MGIWGCGIDAKSIPAHSCCHMDSWFPSDLAQLLLHQCVLSRRRGWCQFELAVNILLGTKPVLLISSETAVKHLCFRMFYHLAPCCAEFTKESDRHHIAAAMQQVVEIQAEEHRISGRSHESQMLECLRSKLLRFPTGSSDPSCQAPGLRRVARTRSFLNLPEPQTSLGAQV